MLPAPADFTPEHIADIDLRDPDVAMFIPFDMVESTQVLRVKHLDQSFRQHGDPVGASLAQPV